ncbi:hypothetical protein [Streptomyces sp. NRRL S-87]|uniref:hypothetical protein n=1 Tax=Streptomyces sp. NRRL S-87 TaxID=1463920 RepID=UPI0004C1C8C9|nr:hypothetical protein [Streptomyces sp. NRRL S-87]
MTNSQPTRRNRLRTAVVAGLMAATALGTAGTALAEGNPTEDHAYNQWQAVNAEGQTEMCAEHSDAFRFRFYFRPDYGGAWVNIGQNIWDLKSEPTGFGPRPLLFCGGSSDGKGQQVANNSASAYNWYDGYCGKVYYYAGYQGASQGLVDDIWPRSGKTLGPTRNNNRSIAFRTCTTW